MANLSSGELGVWIDGEEFVFRPSFRALASLGDSSYLSGMLDRVQVPNQNGFAACLAVLSACCEKDISRLTGFYKDVRGKLRYVAGRLPWQDVYVLGAKCLINGMIGDPKEGRRFKATDKPPKPFDAAEFASSAMIYCKLSSDDAWNMTMHDFQRAMIIKYPDSVRDLPTQSEYKATVETMKRIREKARNG